MNKKKFIQYFNRFYSDFVIFAFLLLTIDVNASDDTTLTGDTLDLNSVINEVIKTHPMIQQAAEALNSADAKIGMAKSGYYPEIDISASYTRLGPVATIPFNGMDFELYPENNYNAALNYNQSIYDFGRTSKHVAYEKESKNLTEQSLESVKQQLTMRTVGTYYSLLYLQEAIKIKDKQLKTLQEHFGFVKKKEETGSATNYEVLSTQVKVSGVESQKLDLEASWKTQLSVLNLLLGKPENDVNYLKETINIDPVLETQDSAVADALKNRSDMQIALENEKLAQIRIQVVKSDYYPSLHAFASGGGKNGYPMDMNKIKLNYAAGVSLHVPLYDASRTKNNVSLANSAYQSTKYETDNTRRKITSEIIDYYQKEQVSLKKIKQYQLQLDLAQKALDLAQTSFSSGSITNLDLLDASNSLAQSQLDLLRSKIEYLVSMFNLKIAIGDRLYE